MARSLWDQHAYLNAVERGLLNLKATVRHVRGPVVPYVKQLGLTAKEACGAARLHHLRLPGVVDG